MARATAAKSTNLPTKMRQRISFTERRRRFGLFIVEVARATHTGKLPIKQPDIRKIFKSRHKIDLKEFASSEIVNALAKPYNNKIWLRKNGHEVYLHSEENTLVDARAIKSLFLAKSIKDGDDRFGVDIWIEACDKKLSCTPSDCETYLSDYAKCGYLMETSNEETSYRQLDIRAMGEDDFYLRQAAKAGMKKRISRGNHDE